VTSRTINIEEWNKALVIAQDEFLIDFLLKEYWLSCLDEFHVILLAQ
jgi:hypothetical protein